MWNKCNVVMLPTNEKAYVGSIVTRPSDNRMAIVNVLTKDDPQPCVHQHLYILSDEEAKEGDWVYCSNGNIKQITRSNIDDKFIENWKKIIACTDKSLVSEYCCIKSEGLITMNAACRERNRCLLPQIPQSFIEHFVSEYNKGNIITEVTVEYGFNNDSEAGLPEFGGYDLPGKYSLKINSDNTIII